MSEVRQQRQDQRLREEADACRAEAEAARTRALRAEMQRKEQALRDAQAEAQVLQARLASAEHAARSARAQSSKRSAPSSSPAPPSVAVARSNFSAATATTITAPTATATATATTAATAPGSSGIPSVPGSPLRLQLGPPTNLNLSRPGSAPRQLGDRLTPTQSVDEPAAVSSSSTGVGRPVGGALASSASDDPPSGSVRDAASGVGGTDAGAAGVVGAVDVGSIGVGAVSVGAIGVGGAAAVGVCGTAGAVGVGVCDTAGAVGVGGTDAGNDSFPTRYSDSNQKMSSSIPAFPKGEVFALDNSILPNMSWQPSASSSVAFGTSLASSIDFSAVEDSINILNLRPEDLPEFLFQRPPSNA
eukprot:TRINITY_DN14779_c0_g1_i3.p1 TRINITY_DN14779_c0_g1~~TRINITY_DN14779_c0_g1_i3.p1  ORF type:complete len:416 (-),score=123.11 TRINITY_DN14779_c0_g1_i3:78-1157(-)